MTPATLKKYKLTPDDLKVLFTAEGKKEKDEIKKLKQLLCDRLRTGREQKLREYRIWSAVDIAYDAPFEQETPTLLRHVLANCTAPEEVMAAAKKWGLNECDLFCKSGEKGKNGEELLALNGPVFYGVLVPVVRAYLSIRLAKLFNDRNGVPLFKFAPQKNTDVNRVRCEIITDIVQAMSTQFGYSTTLKQMILNTLLYSVCILFPVEPWYQEKEEGEDGKEFIVRQGIRYVAPHITNTSWDLQYPLSTMNTNTGCTHAEYWTIGRYGDIESEKRYWNTDKISFSATDWFGKSQPWHNYFQTAYPCVQKFPEPLKASTETNRESEASYYSNGDYDKAIFVTHEFCKLIPKDWGMGEYKYPVWFKFTLAADDTVIYADTYAYNPLVVSLYDTDQNRSRNASLALEIIPSQDLLGNLLTQVLLTNKRNLANIVFYDINQINPEQVETLKVRTHWQYKGINLIPYDPMKDRFSQIGKGECFKQVTFQYADTSQMMQGMTFIINMLERLLVVSAQEIGSAASHQQSKAEIQIIASSTSNRVTYTGSFIDEARDAWKRQLYEGALAYLPSEVVAEISTGVENLEAQLKVLGFKSESTSDKKRVIVKGDKAKLRLEGFSSTRDLPDRGDDVQSATAMLTALTSINNNPRLAAACDVQSVIDLYELAAKKMGADENFNIRVNKDALQIASVAEAMPQITAAIEKELGEKFVKPITEAVAQQTEVNKAQDQQVNQLTGLVTKLAEKIEQVAAIAMQAPPLPPPFQPPIPLLNEAPIGIPTAEQIQPAPVMA